MDSKKMVMGPHMKSDASFVDQSVIFAARLQMCYNHNNKANDIWNLIQT
jgi:hypothetical protein